MNRFNTIFQSIIDGDEEKTVAQCRELLARGCRPIDILEKGMIPAMDRLGVMLSREERFIPQILLSARAMQKAVAIIRPLLLEQADGAEHREKVVVGTVQGDIHDIGKNIVKVLLESYRFRVLDLGKDVPPETIVAAAQARKIPLVGLSALMTTTAPAMVETIRQLRQAGLACKIVVGGAVITQDYARQIGADCYAPDAMATVHYAQEVLEG